MNAAAALRASDVFDVALRRKLFALRAVGWFQFKMRFAFSSVIVFAFVLGFGVLYAPSIRLIGSMYRACPPFLPIWLEILLMSRFFPLNYFQSISDFQLPHVGYKQHLHPQFVGKLLQQLR